VATTPARRSNRINSVKNIQKITRAMEMVAAGWLRRASSGSRLYAVCQRNPAHDPPGRRGGRPVCPGSPS